MAGLDEIESLRSETARFFRDGDRGGHVVQLFTDPISYLEDGEWKPIDSTVVRVDGGFTNAAGSFDVFFPETLSPARPVSLTYRRGALSFSLTGAAPSAGTADGHTVTYGNVHPGMDLAIDVTNDGIKERAIVRSAGASRRLAYRVETDGLDLALEDDGSITVTRSGEPFAVIPPAFAVDSAKAGDSEEPATTHDVDVSLDPRGPRGYALEYEVDRAWMDAAERVYPVTIDPTLVPTRCDAFPDTCAVNDGIPSIKDTYIRQGETVRKDDSRFLYVDKTNGTEARTFMTFDLRQEVRKVGNLVYEAELEMLAEHSAAPTPAVMELRRITEDWDARVTWGDFRPVVHSKVWSTSDGCGPVNCKDDWSRWDIADLAQYWIDTHVPSNHGWEISMSPTSNNAWKEYLSGEAIDPYRRPYVNVWVNAMPGTKDFATDDADWPRLDLATDAIPNGTAIETSTPELAIKPLTDANKDAIVVRYQVSKSAPPNFGNQVVYDTGWIPKAHSHKVPSGYLSNGTYYWRVLASDLCPFEYRDPDEPKLADDTYLCDDLSGDTSRANGPHSERPTSETRSFTVQAAPPQMGNDPRWTMWRRPVGNGANLAVNQANGNAVLDYPIKSLGTPQGPLDVRLSYNSQQAQHVLAGKDESVPGLPPGWELAAGPSLAPDQMPARLDPLSYPIPGGKKTYGVAVVFESGKRDVFVDSGGGLFTQAGPLAATVRSSGGGGWTLTTYSGGTYTFSADGDLLRARPSSARATETGFQYNVVDRRLRDLTDPVGRRLDFTYGAVAGITGDALKEIVAFKANPDVSKRLVWTIEYTNGKISGIQDPDGGKVKLDYDTSNRLIEIFDGEQPADTGKPTLIEYSTADFGVNRPAVSKVFLPAVDVVPAPGDPGSPRTYATAPSTSRWAFDYEPSSANGNYSRTTVVESPRGPATSDVDDYQVETHFNDVGLAILQQGPRVDGPFGGWPKTKMEWDFETGNLVCVRSPAANAIADEPCGASDGLQTQHFYQGREPHVLAKTIESAAVANGPRLITTYGYDEGAQFRGLQTNYFKNTSMSGLPDAVDISPTVSADWGDGGPAQIGGKTDFSVRYFGEWVPGHDTGTKDYELRLTAEDDARLIVGAELLVDCISNPTSNCNGTTQNTAVVKAATPASKRIVVELRAITGPARVKLERKVEGGTWEVVPETSFQPATDVLTSEKFGTVAALDAFSTLRYEYPSAEDKIRGLAARTELVGGSETPQSEPRAVSYAYDDHGRLRRETDATGQPIVHDYGLNDPCPHTTTDRIGLVTTRSCDLSGQVEVETVNVEGLLDGGLPDEQRVTRTKYTGVGRIDWVELADGGKIDYEYDLAGRLKSKAVLEASGYMRVTEFVRNARGWVVEKKLPDPDGSAGPLPRPTVEYRYDDDGNRVVTIDELDKEWVDEWDAGNARTLRKDPVGNEWTWTYDRAGVAREKTDPQDVVVHFTYDALSRLRSRKLGSLTAGSTTDYDLRGYVKTKTDPDGIATSFEYDASGNVLKETGPTGSRTFTFDGSGFLKKQSNFRGHETTFTYDYMGYLKTVKLPGELGEDTTTTYTLNEAGEIERAQLPAGGGTWRYDYDPMGRVKKEVDPSGVVRTTTFNKAGEPLETTDGSAHRVVNVYDHLGRVDWRGAYRIGPPTELADSVDFAYDGRGAMLTAESGPGTVSATYDAAGRVKTATAHGKTTTFDYSGSRLDSRTDAGGTTSYDYDANTGRIEAITGPFGAITTTFDYKPSGRVWRTHENTDLLTTFGYDVAGRLWTKTVTNEAETKTYARFTTEYNGDSQVIKRTSVIDDGTLASPDNGSWHYSYDKQGRLTGATAPDAAKYEYSYDGAGNRKLVKETRRTNNVERVTTTVTDYVGAQPDKATTTVKVAAITGPPVVTDYSHDGAGNLVRIDVPGGWRSFAYDPWGRLKSASNAVSPAAEVTKHVYTYDALDRTLAKTTTAVTAGIETGVARELYWHAGLSHELVQSSLRGPQGVVDEDTVVTSYGYRNGVPYAVQRKTGAAAVSGLVTEGPPLDSTDPDVTTRLLGTNPHGDVVYSTNKDDKFQSITSYDPWGVVRTQVGDDGMLGFQSDPTDSDTGLVDMESRNYLPEMGMFLTRDSYAGDTTDPLSMNRYAYGGGDPVSTIDPDGHKEMLCPNGQTCDSSEELDRMRGASQEIASARTAGYAETPTVEWATSPTLYPWLLLRTYGPPSPPQPVPLDRVYIQTFNLGEGDLDDARRLFQQFVSDPNAYFPFQVTLEKCPVDCDPAISTGNVLWLHRSGGGAIDPGHVRVEQVGSTMFTFRALGDHIAAGGTVTFSLGAWDIAGADRLELEIIAYEAGRGIEGTLNHGISTMATKFSWSDMAAAFNCELIYAGIEEYRRC